jgi:hypothetical protein
MTKEEYKQLRPVLDAWAEGKSVQIKSKCGSTQNWADCTG